jgi:hypothetical protein
VTRALLSVGGADLPGNTAAKSAFGLFDACSCGGHGFTMSWIKMQRNCGHGDSENGAPVSDKNNLSQRTLRIK